MEYLNALNKISGVGSQKIRKLIGFFGNAEKVWKASSQELFKSGIEEKIAGNKYHFIEIGRSLKKLGNKVILIAPFYKGQGTRFDYGLIDEQIELGRKGYLNFLLFHKKLQKRIPELFNVYKPDFVYSRDLINGHKLYKYFKERKIKYMVEINDFIDELESDLSFINKMLSKIRLTQVRNSDSIRVIIEDTKSKLLEKSEQKEIFVIPHGTDPNVYKDLGKSKRKNRFNICASDTVFIFVGTLNYKYYNDFKIEKMLTIS